MTFNALKQKGLRQFKKRFSGLEDHACIRSACAIKCFRDYREGIIPMEDMQKEKFLQDVMSGAAQIEYEDMLLSSRPAQNFGGPPVVDDKSQEARNQALLLSKDATVLQHLCPALKSASGDLESIAKAAGTVLFPLSLTPAAPVSASALAIGALAVLVARAGIAALCPECGGKPKEEG